MKRRKTVPGAQEARAGRSGAELAQERDRLLLTLIESFRDRNAAAGGALPDASAEPR